jgi:hypothetical protein
MMNDRVADSTEAITMADKQPYMIIIRILEGGYMGVTSTFSSRKSHVHACKSGIFYLPTCAVSAFTFAPISMSLRTADS